MATGPGGPVPGGSAAGGSAAGGPAAGGSGVRSTRRATACFAGVLLFSFYALFAPRTGAPAGPDGADKLVHFLLFAALAATTRWRFGARCALLAGVAGYALFSEVWQGLLLSERSGDPRDAAADLLGAVAGWLVARRLRR